MNRQLTSKDTHSHHAILMVMLWLFTFSTLSHADDNIINWGGNYIDMGDWQRRSKTIPRTMAGPLELGGGANADYQRLVYVENEPANPDIGASYSGNSATFYAGMELITLNGVDTGNVHEILYGVREETGFSDSTIFSMKVKASGNYRFSCITYWKNDDSSKIYQLKNISSVLLDGTNQDGVARLLMIVDGQYYISKNNYADFDVDLDNTQLLAIEWTPYTRLDNGTLYPETIHSTVSFNGQEHFQGFGVLNARESLNAGYNTKCVTLIKQLKVMGTANPPIAGTIIRFE